MFKDFDNWNIYKKQLETRNLLYCNTREIWWCSLGINVGAETCGKNDLFERPVLVLRVYNKRSILIAPLTSKPRNDQFHVKVSYENREGWVILSHARTISPKRFQRKFARIDEKQYEIVMKGLLDVMRISGYESAPVLTGASEPEGLMIGLYQNEPYCQADLDMLHTILI
jgi:mRNA interferase MazF